MGYDSKPNCSDLTINCCTAIRSIRYRLKPYIFMKTHSEIRSLSPFFVIEVISTRTSAPTLYRGMNSWRGNSVFGTKPFTWFSTIEIRNPTTCSGFSLSSIWCITVPEIFCPTLYFTLSWLLSFFFLFFCGFFQDFIEELSIQSTSSS